MNVELSNNYLNFSYITGDGCYGSFRMAISSLDTLENRILFYTPQSIITSGSINYYTPKWVYKNGSGGSTQEIYNDTSHLKLLYQYDIYHGTIDITLPNGRMDWADRYERYPGGCVYDNSNSESIPIEIQNDGGIFSIVDARTGSSFGAIFEGYYYWEES